jgi:hypothetical protein
LTRFQLVNQRTIPAQEDIDLYVALVGGLADAQLANDPGGDRWARLLDRAIDTHLHDLSTETEVPRTSTQEGDPL